MKCATELCFWLFVVKAGPMQKDWFSSLYFKMWMIGSCIAILYMPFVTIFTREDPLKVRTVPRGKQNHVLTFQHPIKVRSVYVPCR